MATTTFPHSDHLGSASAATDQWGNLLWREDYTPFGEPRQNTLENRNDQGFTGHIHDHATGLTYMQARYYDPAIGRFLSHDPVGFGDPKSLIDPRFFNRYAYAFNDPINLTDPNGECPWCIGAGLGAAFGAGSELVAIAMESDVGLGEGLARVAISAGAGALAGGSGAGAGAFVAGQLAKTAAARAGMTAANAGVRVATRSGIQTAAGAAGGAVAGGLDSSLNEAADYSANFRDGEFNAENIGPAAVMGALAGGFGQGIRSGVGQHARSVGHSGEASMLRSHGSGAIEATAGVTSAAIAEASNDSCTPGVWEC